MPARRRSAAAPPQPRSPTARCASIFATGSATAPTLRARAPARRARVGAGATSGSTKRPTGATTGFRYPTPSGDARLPRRLRFEPRPGTPAARRRELSVRFPLPRRPFDAVIEKRRAGSVFSDSRGSAAIDPADRAHRPLAAGACDARRRARRERRSRVESRHRHPRRRLPRRRARRSSSPTRSARRTTSSRSIRSASACSDFNVHAVFSPSAESGVTDPYLGVREEHRAALRRTAAAKPSARFRSATITRCAKPLRRRPTISCSCSRIHAATAAARTSAARRSSRSTARRRNISSLHEFAHVIGGLAEEYYIPAARRSRVSPATSSRGIRTSRFRRRRRSGAIRRGAAPQPQSWNKAEYERYLATT